MSDNQIMETNAPPASFEELPCLEFLNQKGLDNLFYNIKIFNIKNKNSIIFKSVIIDDFAEINYSKEYTIKELYDFDYFK